MDTLTRPLKSMKPDRKENDTTLKWALNDRKAQPLVLVNAKNNKIQTKVSVTNLIRFLKGSRWHETLPQSQSISMIPFSELHDRKSQIPIYSVTEYKGLEADVVVIIVNSSRDLLHKHLYVAISRARFYSHLIIDSLTHQKIRELEKRY